MVFCGIYYVLGSSKLNQLKKELLDTAKLISGEKSRLAVNKDVQTVELQISKSGSRRMEESDYYKRKRDPNLWNKERQGDIKLVDLFKQAKKLAKIQAKMETRNAAAEKKYEITHGNWVGISGQAGIGKTTLTKQLLEKVLNKEMLDIDYLFYVSLKKVDYKEKMSVLQFLLTNLDSPWKHDRASDEEILKRLEESEKVMIIFDGLDEATIELGKHCPDANIHAEKTPEILLKNILNGNILRKAKKLITSRPRQMLELHEQYRPHCMVDVLGINLEAQRQISNDICEGDSEKVLEELFNHPELLAQCYVPIMCIFTVYWLHQKQLHPDETITFPSVTNIILNMLETFAAHGIAKCKEFELRKLSKLAWEGLRCKKYEFSENDRKKLELKKESLNTLLTTGTKAKTQLCLLNIQKITYFSHLILQEFFSAAYLMLFLSLSEFKNMLSHNNKQFGNLDIVKNFIFGLCNTITYEHLIALESNLCPDSSDFNNKKSFLEQFVCESAGDSLSDDFSKHLEICTMLYEMHDPELTKKVVERFTKTWKISHNIFPHDVGNLFYVLQERQKLLKLEINNPAFVGDSLERFMSKMAGMPECIKVSTGELKLKISSILIIVNSKFLYESIVKVDISWQKPQSQLHRLKNAFRAMQVFHI